MKRGHEVHIKHNEKGGVLVWGYCKTCNVPLRSWTDVRQHAPRLFELVRQKSVSNKES